MASSCLREIFSLRKVFQQSITYIKSHHSDIKLIQFVTDNQAAAIGLRNKGSRCDITQRIIFDFHTDLASLSSFLLDSSILWTRRNKLLLRLSDGLNRQKLECLSRFKDSFFNRLLKIFGSFYPKEILTFDFQINLPFKAHKARFLPFYERKEGVTNFLVHDNTVLTHTLNFLVDMRSFLDPTGLIAIKD